MTQNIQLLLFMNKLLHTKLRLFLFLPLIFVCFYGCNSCKKSDQNHPNIIVKLADDQGWGDLSINGNKHLHTPNIDLLAESGASFENFYVSAVCSPTRAEFLTGRYAVRGGVFGTSQGAERLDLDEETIAEIFKSNGYKTAAFGKWHNGMQYPYHPNGRGFEEFYGYCSGHWGNYFSPMLEHNGKIVKGNGYLTNDLTDKAMAFMDKNKESPFFLYLPLNTPHSPMQVPDSLWDRFKDIELSQKHPNKYRENIEHTKAALAMVENIDWNVGRIIKKLEELKLEENTILVYFSDNGPNGYRYNGGMKGKKGSVDEGGVKSPFFIQWKGKITEGFKIKQIASALDILPTLASMAGIDFKPKNQLDGMNMEAYILNQNEALSDRHIVNYWKNKTSIRIQNYRLDENNKLFDMIADLGQNSDISDNYPEIYKRMLSQKKEWQNNVLSELPKIDNRSFSIGHKDWKYNILPARDAKFSGNIKRSNRWPNCSYLTNWINSTDSIIWDVDLLEDGKFDVIVYYTCSQENIGSEFQMRFKESSISSKVSQAHKPPILGKEFDRIPREESYTKEFKALKMGTIDLKKGKGQLSLIAKKVANNEVMDFRLLMLVRK